MKRIKFIVFLLILIIGVGIGIYYYRANFVHLPIEEVVPENVVGYVCVHNVEENIKKFKRTKLWQNIKNIDVKMLMEESGVPQEVIEEYQETKAKFTNFISKLAISKLFGKEIALAIYPYQRSKAISPSISTITSNIVVVTRLQPGAEVIKLISELATTLGGRYKIEKERYKNYKITTVEVPKKISINYVKVKDLLIISANKDMVHFCIDVFNKEKKPLSQDKNYLTTKAKLFPPTKVFAYGNLELFFSQVKLAFAKAKVFPQEELTKVFGRWRGFKVVGLASKEKTEKLSEEKIVVIFDRFQISPQIRRIYSFKPQRNYTVDFIPQNIITYQWSNCFDIKSIWDNLKKELALKNNHKGEKHTPLDFISEIEDEIGVNIERELFPALGQEVGNYLADIDVGGFVPLPKILYFIKIKDKPIIEKVITTLTQKNNLSLQSEDYKDVTIKYLLSPFGINLQPGYCFLNDYLLISNTRSLLQASIDAFHEKATSLSKNKDFQDVNLGLTGRNNAISFVNTDVLFYKIRQLCQWGVRWLSLIYTREEHPYEMAKQQWEALREKIQQEKEELEKWKVDLQKLKKETDSSHIQEANLTPQEKKLVELEEKIRVKEEEITFAMRDLKRKKQQLEQEKKRLWGKAPSPSLIKLFVEKVIYPILDGLRENKIAASRVIFKQESVEMFFFSKS